MLNQRHDIVCSRVSAIDNKVGVLLRYLRIADTKPFEAGRLDKLSGGVRLWVFESAPGIGHSERLRVFAISKIVPHDCLNFVFDPWLQLEPHAGHDAARHTRAPI